MKKVLLVDDDELFNYLNRRLLEKSGFASEIFVAYSGEQALSLWKEWYTSGVSLPDFIFLDLRMPVMDGFQFLEHFSKLPPECIDHVRIVILTSSLDAEDKEKVFQYNPVVGFLNKPLNKKSIGRLMHEFGMDSSL